MSTYIRFGFEHILIGLDHIAFLLTLLLLPASWRQRLWIVTGFTLGHSVTLSLSTLGLISPDIQFTEALIGLSIALVAIENVTMRSEGRRAAANMIGALLLALQKGGTKIAPRTANAVMFHPQQSIADSAGLQQQLGMDVVDDDDDGGESSEA